MISLDVRWDLSATIQQSDVNDGKFQTKLPGRFDPETVAPEDISALCYKLIDGFTTNTMTGILLTAQRNLSEIE